MLSVDRKALLAALETLKTITPKSGTLPVLSNVQLSAEGGALRLAATDLYRAAWLTLPGDGSGTWSRAVDLRTTLDRAKRFRNGHCSIGPEGTNELSLTEGPRAFKMRGMDPADMPPMPSEDKASPVVTLDDATLAAALDRVLYAVSTDETRPHLNSVRFEVTATRLRLVSTDGHRLALWDTAVEAAPSRFPLIEDGQRKGEITFLLALDGCTALRSMVAPKKGRASSPVSIATDGKTVFAKVRGVTLALRIVQAPFPPYAQVIPAHSERTVTCDRALLAEVVDAIGGCAPAHTGRIELTVDGKTLRVHTRDSQTESEANETIPVTVTGQGTLAKRGVQAAGTFTIGVNAVYLKSALAEMTGDTVAIGLSGHLDPIVIRPPEGGVTVVMPMRPEK